MARASTPTLIPLDKIAEHLGIDHWHFNGMSSPLFPLKPSCDDDFYQFNWQNVGKISREGLAQALAQAEAAVERHLAYAPAPRWYEETVTLSPYYRTEARSLLNSRTMSKSVYAEHGYVFEVGRRVNTYIDTPATVLTDPDGDGITELVTITFATTVTDEEELRVYYPGKDGADIWEIRPLTSVTIAGGNATITFPKWLIGLQALLEANPSPDDPHVIIDATDDTNFLTEVDVYRVYTDVSQQATFQYEPGLNCATTFEYSTDSGALLIRDERLGILAYQRADWDAVNAQFNVVSFDNYPDRLTMYYRAGKKDNNLPMPTRDMNKEYERLIVYYALSLLDTRICGCDNTVNIWKMMTRDMAEAGKYTFPWGKLSNPLGTSFAALRLWEAIQPDKINRPHGRRL